MEKELVWLIGGEAGQGIMVSGRLFAKVATKAGLYSFAYPEYPSLIRGGHNSFQVRLNQKEVSAPARKIDLLVALNQETFTLHQPYLKKTAGVIFDPQKVSPQGGFDFFPVPLEEIAKRAGNEILRNTAAIGASLAAVGGKIEFLTDILTEEFKDKKEQIIQMNLQAAREGFEEFRKKFKSTSSFSFSGLGKDLICLTGNEAIALGAIASSCKFYCAYPMTPVSSILHFLAFYGPSYGMLVKQAEDEISVINTAIGASFAGARSMVATSGGGFALMTETLSLAGATETPLVLVEGQRPAPATGIPTWHSQGDAAFVLHAGHGDFPRIVLAPRNIRECFYLTFEAFNLAEQFQNPVIILVDKLLCESLSTVSFFKTKSLKINRGKIIAIPPRGYKRYQFTEDGISPRAFPGQGEPFLTNSDEHDEEGFSCERRENRIKMMAKRAKKQELLEKELPPPEIFGDTQAKVSLFSWGSTWAVAKETVIKLQKEGIKANLISSPYLQPLPFKFGKLLKKPGKKVFIENNFSGQVAAFFREKTGCLFDLKILKDDGRPFYTEEIIREVRKII